MKKCLTLAALAALMLSLSGCFETTTFNLQISGVVTEFGSSAAISGVTATATVQGKFGSWQDVSDLSGGYSIALTGLISGSVITVVFSNPGYVQDSATFARSSGGVYVLNMSLSEQFTGAKVEGYASLMNLVPPASSIPSTVRIGFKVQKTPVVPEPTEIILAPKAGVRPDKINVFLAANNTKAVKTSFERGYLVVPVPEGKDIDEFIKMIEDAGIARYVEANSWAVINSFWEPQDDYLLTAQWNMFATSMPYVWDMADFGAAMVVAVLDTGVYVNHPDLLGRTLTPIDTIYEPSGTQDVHGHGTHVAGIIASIIDNSQYMAGMSNKAALVLPVKVLSDDGRGTVASVADGIDAAVAAGADIISMSLGYTDALPRQTIVDAINDAVAAGVTIVAAAGNAAEMQVDFPANNPNVIAVSAVKHDFTSSDFTNYGLEVDFAAPGGNVTPPLGVWSLYPASGGLVGALAGTSQATPHVAALLAMLMQQGHSKSAAIDMMAKTAQYNDRSPLYFGNGIINAYSALNELTMDKAVFWLADIGTGSTVTSGYYGYMDRSFEIPFEAAPDNYYLRGWVDTDASSTINDGDYYGSEEVTVSSFGLTLGHVLELGLYSTTGPSSIKQEHLIVPGFAVHPR